MKNGRLAAIIGAASLLFATTAHATPILDVQIISGGQSVECNGCATGGGTFTGGATGSFTQSAQGDITFIGSVGSSTLNVTIAQGANFIATPNVVLNNAQTVSSGGPVIIEATDYGQTLAQGTPIQSNFSTSTDVNGPATGTFETFYSTTNQLFGGTSLTGGAQTITGAVNQTYGIGALLPAVVGGQLSESIVVSLNQPTGNSFGFTTSISPVPEPASLALFGTALAGLGLLRRRRRNV